MSKSSKQKKDIRNKIIGLGKDSIHKSYYPQLQKHIKELEFQKSQVEIKNEELIKTLVNLQHTKSKLQTSEERFRTVFENANDAIFIQDSSFKVVECNNTALKIFQTSRDNILNKPPNLLIPDELSQKELIHHTTIEKMRRALKGTPQAFEIDIKSKKTTEVSHIYLTINRFELDNQYYLQTIVRDTSQIKKLQQELLTATIQTEERERARFAKELHDGVGPILSTIKLYFQWLAETSDPNQREIIIKKGNNNISEAIKALKEVSNNLSPHILSNYGLEEGLEQFIDGINSLGKLKIELNYKVPQRLKHDIELSLYRVSTELINNTLKHAEATTIGISFQVKSDVLEVTYKDNGKGFEQKKVTSKGLGLFNIRNRIQNLGGDIRIKSKPNKGFKLKLSLILNDDDYR